MKQVALLAILLYSSTGVGQAPLPSARLVNPTQPFPKLNLVSLGPVQRIPLPLPPPDWEIQPVDESPEHPDVEPPPQPVPVYIKPKPVQPAANYLHAWISDQLLHQLRQCESTNNYTANTGNGFKGAYQYLQSTWNAAAVTANRPDLVQVPPHQVSPQDQDHLTKVWWQASDYRTQWPVCGPLAIARAG